ncbi:MAG: hypothetical protein V7739_15060 [Motiliproteus sp.]
METQSLHNLVEQVAAKEDVALIVSALECLEIQSEIRLTETTATGAIERAVGYMERDLGLFSSPHNSFCIRQQLITEYLQQR